MVHSVSHDRINGHYGIPQNAEMGHSSRSEPTYGTPQDAEAEDDPDYELPTPLSCETAGGDAGAGAAPATDHTSRPIYATPQDAEAAADPPGTGGGDAVAALESDGNGMGLRERPGRPDEPPQEPGQDGEYEAIHSLHAGDKDGDFRAADGTLMPTGNPAAADPGSAQDLARSLAQNAERDVSGIADNPSFGAPTAADTAAAATSTPPVARAEDDDSGSDYDNVDEHGVQAVEPTAVDDGGVAGQVDQVARGAMVESPDSPSGTTV